MTSIIKVDTIQNKAGSTSLAANKLPDMLSGSAKVHVSYDGDSNVVDESFNVASVTDKLVVEIFVLQTFIKLSIESADNVHDIFTFL